MSDVKLTADDAKDIRRELTTAQNTVWWFELVAMFVMPLFLGLLGNALVTQVYSQSPDYLVISITIALLLICTALQLLFGIVALRRQNVHSTIDFAAHRTEISDLRAELRRKTEVHNTLRSSFDEFNVQVCNVSGWFQTEFQQLLDHVFAPTRTVIDRILGVHNRVYTIELYIDDSQLPEFEINWETLEQQELQLPTIGSTWLSLRYFYASERLSAGDALQMGNRHPAVLAWSTSVPDEYIIDKFQELYGSFLCPQDDVYFRRVITVPVRMVCSSDSYWGVLVITTMQSEPLAEDVIDNLQWLSTLTTNFINAYNKCRESQKEKLESARRSRGQKQRREREQTAATAVIDGDNPQES